MPDQLNITADEVIGASDFQPASLALLCGRVVATVVSKRTGEHITVQVRCKAKREGKWVQVPFTEAARVWADVPGTGGPDRGCDAIGTYYPVGSPKYSGQFWYDREADPARVWAALFVLRACAGRAVSPAADLLAGCNCLMCGRELSDPESIERNIGPDCYEAATGSVHQHKNAPERSSGPQAPSEPSTPGNPCVAPLESVSAPQASPDGLFERLPGQRMVDIVPAR